MPAKKSKNALAPLEDLLQDPQVMEVMIDGVQRVTFEKSGKIEDAGFHFQTAEEVVAVIEAILNLTGGKLEEGKTACDVRLADNSRMFAVFPPAAIDGPYVVFRKWMTKQITWEKLFEYQSITPEMKDIIQGAIRAGVGILVAGGTGSGKTTLANRVVELIPPDQRIIAVEETHLYQFEHPRAIYLEAKGAPDFTLNDALTAASKMRPDWLVVGELQGAEAMRVAQLFCSGYSGLAAIHATDAENALARLETMCLMANLGLGLEDIRRMIASAFKFVTYQERLPGGARKVTQMMEIKSVEGGRYALQPLARYNPESRRFELTGVKAGWQK